ncbi:hypothetical protein [Ectopseudomonas oleovorans]|uniref:hypothetical protein n=1 Tax=Ectopseudomonas oleovorans TaxID=301 RepID=UPI003F1DB4A2
MPPAIGWAREYCINERGAIRPMGGMAAACNAIAERGTATSPPVFTYDDDGRIHRFSSFGLVNAELADRAQRRTTHHEEHPDARSSHPAALGLPETSTKTRRRRRHQGAEGGQGNGLNSEKAPSLQLYVPRGDYNALEQRALNAEQQLKQRAEDELKTAINTEIDAALKAGKITPATKAYHLAACQEEAALGRSCEFVVAAPR